MRNNMRIDRIKNLIFVILLIASSAHAQVAEMADKSKAELNQQLRYTQRRLFQLETIQNINTLTTGTLNLNRGGTGQALTDPNADRFFLWDDSASKVDWFPSATPSVDKILFWDFSAEQPDFLTLGTGLSITTTTIDGTDPGVILLSTTSPSAVATTSAITIDDNKFYLIKINLSLDSSTNDVFALRINSISTTTRYVWIFDSMTLTTTPTSTLTGDDSDSEIEISLSRRHINAEIFIDTRNSESIEATIYGKGLAAPTGAAVNSAMDIWGVLNANDATDIADFLIFTIGTNAFTGTIKVFEYD